MVLQEAITDYFKSIRRLDAKTQKGYKQRMGVFYAWCKEQGIEQLESIKANIVTDFVEHLRQNHKSSYHSKSEVSTHTTAGYVRCIKAFLSFCLDDETYSHYVSYNTLRRIKLPKREKYVIQVFTDKQLQALFAATQKEMNTHLRLRDQAILALLIDTGIRANELCTLTLEHTHLEIEDPYILVKGKGSKWREVGLGKHCRETLQKYVETWRANTEGNDTTFIGRYNQEALTVGGLERVLRRLAKWAKIKGIRCSPHSFRHTYATRFLLNGSGDLYKLSLLLGHEGTKVTEIYLKTVESWQVRKRASSVLDEMQIS